MWSFSFSLDHAEIMARVQAFWNMIDANGMATLLVNLLAGVLILLIFISLFHDSSDASDA